MGGYAIQCKRNKGYLGEDNSFNHPLDTAKVFNTIGGADAVCTANKVDKQRRVVKFRQEGKVRIILQKYSWSVNGW